MNSVLTPLLAMTAWFLGLSILVQVLQELWKFSTSSKSRAFEMALADFLGPFVLTHLRQDARLTVRGPLQFRRVSIAGHVLPLNADDLITSIQKAAPEWQQLLARALDFEASLQKGAAAPPSAAFQETLAALRRQLAESDALAAASTSARGAADSRAFGGAAQVEDFLKRWGVGDTGTFDAERVRLAFRREFFPQFETIARHYDQFLQNFGYQYRRRNLRQTFAIAMLVTVLLNLPFDQIYVRATALSPEQAIALAENARQLYAEAERVPEEAGKAERQRLRTLGQQALDIAQTATNLACGDDAGCRNAGSIEYPVSGQVVLARLGRAVTSPRYLFGCFISAVLISFGAPFWNDVSSSLLRAARPRREQQKIAAPDRPVTTGVE